MDSKLRSLTILKGSFIECARKRSARLEVVRESLSKNCITIDGILKYLQDSFFEYEKKNKLC